MSASRNGGAASRSDDGARGSDVLHSGDPEKGYDGAGSGTYSVTRNCHHRGHKGPKGEAATSNQHLVSGLNHRFGLLSSKKN